MINYEELTSLWRKRCKPKQNQSLLLIIDCCYSGSWVDKLLEKGDFNDISIQASSTREQKSWDLGIEGSLFTNLFINSNKKLLGNFSPTTHAHYLDKMVKQFPVSFAYENVFRNNFQLKELNFNSWKEIFPSRHSNLLQYHTDQLEAIAFIYDNEKSDRYYSLNKHLVFTIDEGIMTIQGEFPMAELLAGETEKEVSTQKTKIQLIMRSPEIYIKHKGNVSFWKINEDKGVFFMKSGKSELKFNIQSDTITLVYSELIKLVDDLKNESFDYNLHTLELLKLKDLITEVNKVNCIDFNEVTNDEENAEEDDDMLEQIDNVNVETTTRIEKLSISGHKISGEAEASLLKYLESEYSSIKQIDYQNTEYMLSLPSTIKKIKLALNEKSQFSLYKCLRNNLNNLQEIYLDLTNNNSDLVNKLSYFLDVVALSTSLTSFDIKGLSLSAEPQKQILDVASGIKTLLHFGLHYCRLEIREDQHTLWNSLSELPKLKSISLVGLGLMNLPSRINPKLESLDLSSNSLTNDDVISIMENLRNLTHFYSVSFSNNLLSDAILPPLKDFLKKNQFCLKFEILKCGLLEDSILTYTDLSILQNNQIVTLDLSHTPINKRLTSIIDLIKNTKQIETLILKDCNLINDKLKDVFELISDKVSNSISCLDVSSNTVSDERVFNTIRLKIPAFCRLTTLKMANCFIIKGNKTNLNMTKFLITKNNYLEHADYSGWEAEKNTKFEIDFLTKLTKTELELAPVRNLNLMNTPISYVTKDKRILEFDTLGLDSSSIVELPFSFKLKGLKIAINDSNNCEFIQKLVMNSKIENLEIINNEAASISASALISLISNVSKQTLAVDDVKENESTKVGIKVDKLILNDIDHKVADRLISMICDNEGITQTEMTFRKSYYKEIADKAALESLRNSNRICCLAEKFEVSNCVDKKKISNHLLYENYISDELKQYFIRRAEPLNLQNYVNLNKDFPASNEVSINNIPSHIKYLTLNCNIYDADYLNSLRLENLEVLELNKLQLTCFNNCCSTFLQSINNLKALIIKDSEINSTELLFLNELLKKHTNLEELHLVNTYIDGRESNVLFKSLSYLAGLKVLNLSKNVFNNILINNLIDYIKKSEPLESLILAYSCLTMAMVDSLLSLKHFKRLNLSGLCNDEESNLVPFEDNFNKINKKYFLLELTYATRRIVIPEDFYRSNTLGILLYNVNFSLMKNELYEYLQGLKRLQVLRIFNCENYRTLFSLLDKIVSNTTICTLDASETLFNQASMIDLCNIINKQQNRICLDLSYCQLIDKTLEVFLERINYDKLQTLNISYNMLTVGTYARILKIFNDNPELSLVSEYSINADLDISRKTRLHEYMQDLENIPSQKKKSYEEMKIYKPSIKNNELFSKGYYIFIEDGDLETAIIQKDVDKLCLKHHKFHNVNCAINISFNTVAYSSEKKILIYNTNTEKCISVIQESDNVYSIVKLSEDHIAASCYNKIINIWNINTKRIEYSLTGHDGPVSCVKISDNMLASSGSYDCTIKIWDLVQRQCIRSIKCNDSIVSLLYMGNELLLSGVEDDIYLWNIATGENTGILKGHKAKPKCLVKLSNNLIASGAQEKTIWIWNVETKQSVGSIVEIEYVTSLLRIDSERIAVGLGTQLKPLNIWNFNTYEHVLQLGCHEYGVQALLKVDDDHIISISTADEILKKWYISSFGLRSPIAKIHEDAINSIVKVSNDYLMTASQDKTIKMWNLHSGECVTSLSGHDESVLSLVSITKELIASGGNDAKIKVWNIFTNVCAMTLSGHKYGVYSLLALDSNRLVSASNDDTLKVWNLTTFKCIFTLKIPSINSFLIMNKNIFTSCSNEAIRFHSFNSYECIGLIKNQGGRDFESMAQINGDLIAVGDNEGLIKVWNVKTMKQIFSTQCSRNKVFAMILMSQSILVSLSHGRETKIWSLISNENLAELSTEEVGHQAPITCGLKYTEALFISASQDQTMKIWNKQLKKCVKTIGFE